MIRKMTRDDLWYVQHTKGQLFGPDDSLKRIEDAIFNRKDSTYLIVETPQISGYIGAHVNFDDAEIITVFVDPLTRNQGVGSKLLEAMLSQLKKNQVKTVTLEVSVNNDAAIRLYTKAGFITVHTRAKYYDDGSDARVMLKELT